MNSADKPNTPQLAAIISQKMQWSRNDWPIVAALALLTLLVRGQTFTNPVLGFDEQFYLLVGHHMLHGELPYVDIFDRKPIALFLIYALADSLGPDPFLQYKLLAAACVWTTAALIYRAARPISSPFGAATAASLYVLWLNFMEGEGGQAAIYYNLLTLIAALLTWRALKSEKQHVALGCGTMLLIGIAIQIKDTVVFEGVFFGLVLIWARYRATRRVPQVIAPALLWIVIALLPTTIAMLAYWRLGAINAFIFANFISIFGRVPDPVSVQMLGLVEIVGVLAPLLVLLALDWRRARDIGFPLYWLGAAVFGMLIFGSFLSPAYALPVLAPLCLVIAPYFARASQPKIIVVSYLLIALVVGQAVIWRVAFNKGGRAEAMTMAAAAMPRHGCIWVYDGYPALYMLTNSCLPTRWVFPGHLNTADEASVKAIGVDPVTEVKRILATHPDVIIDDAPVYRLGNPQTRALVEATLRRDYRLALSLRTGTARYRLVYRLK